jgi:hypothetical protein
MRLSLELAIEEAPSDHFRVFSKPNSLYRVPNVPVCDKITPFVNRISMLIMNDT